MQWLRIIEDEEGSTRSISRCGSAIKSLMMLSSVVYNRCACDGSRYDRR